jgi:hypothetical protein
MQNTENFYCYSLRLFHYLSAFDEKCSASRISKTSGNRYWVFKKSDRLDKIIQSYNATKHNFNWKQNK